MLQLRTDSEWGWNTCSFRRLRFKKTVDLFCLVIFALLIQPVTAVLLLIKNHLAPPAACVSAIGWQFRRRSVPNRRDASSGAE
jgi:hypothetical protein